MKLVHSFPKLTEKNWQHAEAVLKKTCKFPGLPADYKAFLFKQNGGMVSPGPVDATRDADHREEVVFPTPLCRVKQNHQPVTPALVMFFGIAPPDDDEEREVYELIASNRYSREDFDILPDQMMSIAKCSHPDAADMLCLSLGQADYGAVYYFNEFWDRPAQFFGPYFAERIQKVVQAFGLTDETDFDEDTKVGKKIKNELRRVPFVKVADSFSAFLKGCQVVKVAAK